jgi:WD40 repeat protein
VPGHRETDDADLVVIELDEVTPSGPDRPPAPGRDAARGGRPRLVAVVVVLALVFGAVVTTVARHHHGTHRNTATTVVHRGTHPLLPYITGTSLVVADGTALRRVDLDTGDDTTARFPQFASGALQLELATSDALVVRTAAQQTSPFSRFVVPADLGTPPVGVATERQMLAAAPDDRHVLRLDDLVPRVDELDAQGRARIIRANVGMSALAVVGTHAGLLFVSPGSWVLLDPTSAPPSEPTVHRASLVAAGPATAVAAASSCTATMCPVQAVDLATGTARAVPDHGLGALLASYGGHGLDLGLVGRVSPDGRRLAVVGTDDRLLVVDLVTGAATATHLSTLGLGSIAWSPDGRTLFALAGEGDRGAIAAYRTDTARVELLHVGLRQAASLVAVPSPTGDRAAAPRPTPTITVPAPTGPLLGGHTGLTLVSQEPSTVRVVDADTGAVYEVDIPPPSATAESSADNSFATIPAEAGRVPVVVDGSVAFVHQGGAYAFDPRTRRFLQLGAARAVYASTAPGRVWTVAPGPPTGTGAVVWTTNELDVHTGAPITTRLAPDAALGVTDAGLVFERQTTSGARFDVWDPATGRIVRSVAASTAFASVLDARGRWLLYADSSCNCTQLVDVHDGTQRPLPGSAQAAGLAPDGQSVALSTGGAAGTWSVVDLASGSVTPVPALGLEGARPVWSPDGRWLFGATYEDGVHALPLPAGARNGELVAPVAGIGGASWFSVAGRP